jgi:uncharacterized protein YbaP (TraB family)
MIYKQNLRISARLTAWLFCLYSFTGHGQKLDPGNQLLWQITGKGLSKPSYLYGSFHSNDVRLFHFTDSTYAALLHAEAIVLEADIYSMFTEYDTRIGNPQMKYDAFGNPYTSDKTASRTKYGDENGRPQFLDAYFQQIAYNTHKMFFPLETIEDQLEVFENINDRKFSDISVKSLTLTQENILQTYLQGDIENMRQIMKSQLSMSGNAYALLITNRNQIMAAGIDSLCRRHSLFIAVGAAHLAGTEGIISLLRAKGFTVRQVLASYAEKPTQAELTLRQFNSYSYTDSVYHFSAVFGGKPKIDADHFGKRLTYQEMGQGNTFSIGIEKLDGSLALSSQIDDLMNKAEKSEIREVKLPNGSTAYEGIGYEIDYGLCWKRIFVHDGQLFRLICFGGNKFMNSNRPKQFFERVLVY